MNSRTTETFFARASFQEPKASTMAENNNNEEDEPISIESMIQRRILLNNTAENQLLAKAILEFMGEGST